MSDISGISTPQRLTSQLKVSLESMQKPPGATASVEVNEIKQFEAKLEQINHGIALMGEIRHSLEAALRELS